jgi:hypothetical protein
MNLFDDTYKMELVKKYPIPYFSYSQLNTFLTCPESYRLTYMTGKFESTGNKYTELGSVLHDIFEQEGKMKIFGEPEKFFTKGQAYKKFNKDFIAVKDKHKEYFTDKEDFIAMYQKGIKAIDNYYELYENTAPIFVERKFQKVVAEGLPPSKAFIDRIDGDPADASTWIVSDYKTGGSPKSKDYLRNDFQLALYVLQIYAETGCYPKAVQFIHPVPAKIQTAVHQGNGVYKFQGQRAPVVEFNVADTIIMIRDTIAKIVETIESMGWKKQVDSWGCKMCFHFISGKCKPFDKQQQGWSMI